MREALAVVMGTVIGSGIFFKPAPIAHALGRLDLIVLVWVAGGLVSLFGALTYAELAAMMPRAGGPYAYLRASYGRLWGFLLGWTEFWILRTGAVAAAAVASATGLGHVFGIPPALHKVVAVALIAALTLNNVLSTRKAGHLLDFATLIKVGGLLFVSLSALALGSGSTAYWGSTDPGATVSTSLVAGVATAYLSVMWAYDGWVNVTTLAEEVEEPQRTIPRALWAGMVVVTALYVLATLAFHFALPVQALGASTHAAASVAGATLGAAGAVVVTVLVLLSTVGTLHANLLCGPRIFFAMAREGNFFSALARIHPIRQTPANAILAFSGWSIVLVLAGDLLSGQRHLFDVLTDYVMSGALLFSTLAITTVFVLRSRFPDTPRPYRTWGYPWVPAAFALSQASLLVAVVAARPWQSLLGLVFVLAGIPAFLGWSRQGRPLDQSHGL